MSEGFEPGPEFESRYRVQSSLGAGRTGPALLVEEIASGEARVARFVVGPGIEQERVLQAAAPFEGLDHPNLARLLATGTSSGGPFLVYAQVEGAAVPRLLEKHGSLGPAAALRILRGVAEALVMLHERGLAHGGLRAANVVLDRKGTPKLVDVGIHAGAPGAGPAADLKALGQLAYVLLVGEHPPSAGPTRPSAALDEVPGDLDALVGRLAAGEIPDAGTARGQLRALLDAPEVGTRKDPYPRGGGGGSAGAPPEPAGAPLAAPPAPPPPRAADLDEPSGDGPPPAVDGSVSGDFHQRKARAIVEATTVARKKKAAPPKLEVRVGQREGPTKGSLYLLLLGGAGMIVGVAYLAFVRPEFQGAERFVARSEAEEAQEVSQARRRGDLPEYRLDEDASAQELGRAIIEEARTVERAALVKDLLEDHPEESPTVLTTILKGGNDRLRRELFPFLVPLDPRGIFRLQLMRFAATQEGFWPQRLASSLSASGFTSELREIGEEKRGWGALVALAASTRGSATLPEAIADRLETRFFQKGETKQEELVQAWVRASGGGKGAVAPWLARHLIHRATDDEERMLLLAPLGELEPSAEVFESLAESLGTLGLAWGIDVVEVALEVLEVQAGDDPARQRKLATVRRRVRG